MYDRISFTSTPHDGPVAGNPIYHSQLSIGWPIGSVVSHSQVAKVLGDLDIGLPEFEIRSRRFPGVAAHPHVGITVTPEQSDKLTVDVLELIETQAGALSVNLYHSFYVPKVRFEITPELWEQGIQRLPPMLHRQAGFAHSILRKALLVRGPYVTDAEISGIVELATEHLWPAIMEDVRSAVLGET